MTKNAEENTFIEIPKTFPLHPDLDLLCYFAQFHRDNFDLDLYSKFGIHLPKNIHSSALKRKSEFLAGRICAQSALQAKSVFEHQVHTGAYREPVWPVGLLGSISHSNSHAAAVVCDDRDIVGVGIDIEKIVERPDILDAVISCALSPLEFRYIQSLTTTVGLAHLVTLIFSVKESFFKAAFGLVKTYFDFDCVHVVDIDLSNRVVYFEVKKELNNQPLLNRRHCAYFDFAVKGLVFTSVSLKR